MSIVHRLMQVPLFSKFIKFGIVGASGMVVDYGVLILLRKVLGFPDWLNWLSIAIAFIAAASSNYVLNRIWTFRSKNRQIRREYVSFIVVSLIGLGITELVMSLLGDGQTGVMHHLLGFELGTVTQTNDAYFYINKFIAIVVTTLWNFFGNMFITFHQHRDKSATPKDNQVEDTDNAHNVVDVVDNPKADSQDV